jgi:hypothetical protein
VTSDDDDDGDGVDGLDRFDVFAVSQFDPLSGVTERGARQLFHQGKHRQRGSFAQTNALHGPAGVLLKNLCQLRFPS